MLLRVHQSNFRVVGFSERPQLAELAAIARRHELPLVDDLGSGALARDRRRADSGGEPSRRRRPRLLLRRQAARRAAGGRSSSGAPTSSSGCAGTRCSARCARTSSRSLRSRGRSTLALDPETRDAVPVLRMLHEPIELVRARAERLAELVGGEVEETVARVGGGALPLAELPSAACAVEEELAEPLRLGEPPVIARRARRAHAPRLPDAYGRRGRRGRRRRPRCAVSVVEVELPAERSRLCEHVLRDLPDWFGIEEATAAYISRCRGPPDLRDRRRCAALAEAAHADARLRSTSWECGARGTGRASARRSCRRPRSTCGARSIEYLQVKTLGPSYPDEGYARTRAFYEARGFVPLEELHGLWADNPCLLLVKRL